MLTRHACAITQRAIFAATNIQIVYYNLYSFKYAKQMSIKAL